MNPITNVTLLTDEQIWGDAQGNGQLQVMKDYGTKTGMSDLAIVLGGPVGRSDTTSDDQRSGYVWSASSDDFGCVRTVHEDGGVRSSCDADERRSGVRPVLTSDVSAEALAKGEAKHTKKISGVDVVKFGEYPQTIAPESVSRELEQSFSRAQLQTTGKKYTFDVKKRDAYDRPFKPKEYAEYQHSGKRYIRVEAQPFNHNSILSNGKKLRVRETCWIEVQPIEWLKDPNGVMVARQALVAGVQFDRKQSYDGNFANTDMHSYLQNYFAKEMLPQQEQAQKTEMNQPEKLSYAQSADASAKDKLRPLLEAAFDALSVKRDARQFETALEAGVAKQKEPITHSRG